MYEKNPKNKILDFINKILNKDKNKLLLNDVNNEESDNTEKRIENRKIENLVVGIILLVITLLMVKYIFSGRDNTDKNSSMKNGTSAELVQEKIEENTNEKYCYRLQEDLKNILMKIDGVGEVEVLITVSETNKIIPIYNENISESKTKEEVNTGGTRVIENYDSNKEVVSDGNSNIITEKIVMPKIEGAIVTAEGAKNIETKNNIISAVEAATGLKIHKIQVFEMKK